MGLTINAIVLGVEDLKRSKQFDGDVWVPESRPWALSCEFAKRGDDADDRWMALRRQVTRPRLDWADRAVLAEYADHYNLHRPHRALGQAPPLRPGVPVVLAPPARIVARDRLGGGIHEYAQVAWGDSNIWHPHVGDQRRV